MNNPGQRLTKERTSRQRASSRRRRQQEFASISPGRNCRGGAMARITNMRWERLAVGLPFLVLLASTHAQQLPTFEVSFYIGQNVSSVDIAGRPDVTLKKVQDLISVSPGKPLSQKDVDSSIAALKQRGGFQDVKLDRRHAAAGLGLTVIM